MRRAARRDANHYPICDALKARGYLILDLSLLGCGAPDVAVIDPNDNRVTLLEFKVPKTGRVSDRQKKWHADHPQLRIYTVRSVVEALAAVGVQVTP